MHSESSASVHLVLPDDFDSNEWEIRAKGYYLDALIRVEGEDRSFVFYDSARLSQDLEAGLSDGFVFLPERTVVLAEVTRANIEAFVAGYSEARSALSN